MNPIGATCARRALVAALLAIMTLTAAACGSTPDKPTAHAAQEPAGTSAHAFVSRQYGFRLTLTKDWSKTDAVVAWDGKKLQGLSSPAFANFTDASADRSLAVAAARVAKGMSMLDWRAAMVRAAPDICSESRSARQTTLGGERALAWTARCSDGYEVHKLAAVHRRRGYMILLASQTSTDEAQSPRIFESIRRSSALRARTQPTRPARTHLEVQPARMSNRRVAAGPIQRNGRRSGHA